MTSRKRLLLPILIASVTLALLLAGMIGTRANQAAPPPQVTAVLATDAPDATATPTPFQPSPPTPTYLPTAFPTPEPVREEEPQPVVEEDTEPAAPIELPQEQVNILLLGSDQRVGEIGFRTDTIILLSLNPQKKTVSMVSFPRDLYLYLPGYSYQRINTAMYYGGFSLLAETLEYHFGVRPSHYVLIGLNAFVETIDSLNGIDVQVAERLTDHRTGHGNYTVNPGTVHMDGTTALWYVRARYTTNDFDRTRRQQEVIQAIAKRMLSLNALENGDELFDIYEEYVSTNMTWSDVAPMVPLAAQIGDPAKIRRYAVGPGQVISWVTPGGAQVLLPQKAAIQSIVQQAVNP
jgi:LCP family protein required for cell wall assembly